MNPSKVVRTLKWLANDTEFIFAAEQLNVAADLVEKLILWGADLISCNTDAHVSFCTECGFPIADYGVDAEIYCTMCKSKNSSHNYAATGPGFCRTTCDRKAKTYDKLFRSRRDPEEDTRSDGGVLEEANG